MFYLSNYSKVQFGIFLAALMVTTMSFSSPSLISQHIAFLLDVSFPPFWGYDSMVITTNHHVYPPITCCHVFNATSEGSWPLYPPTTLKPWARDNPWPFLCLLRSGGKNKRIFSQNLEEETLAV